MSMRLTRKSLCAMACAAAHLLLAACGDGGGRTPFPTESIDQLPSGARIDVSQKNLFQMGAGDFWSYSVVDDLTTRPGGTTILRKVVSDDGAGHVALEDDDGGADVTPYTVTPDGLLNTRPLGDVPAGAAYLGGDTLECPPPPQPVDATRT